MVIAANALYYVEHASNASLTIAFKAGDTKQNAATLHFTTMQLQRSVTYRSQLKSPRIFILPRNLIWCLCVCVCVCDGFSISHDSLRIE